MSEKFARSVSLGGGLNLDETAGPIDAFGLNAAIADQPKVNVILQRVMHYAETLDVRGNSCHLQDKPKTGLARPHNDDTQPGDEARVTRLGQLAFR